MKEEMKTNRQTGTNANVQIDTNAFIRHIANAGSNDEMPAQMPIAGQSETPEETPEPATEKPAKRKRSQAMDYESLFLSRNELRDRQGLYIDRENYEILQTLVRSIRSERLSVSGLVDNIVRHHIETHEDEIKRIYEENIRKPIKRKQ